MTTANPEYVPETYLGQILEDGRWLDYARGSEASSRTWQAGDPANRRVVDWISRKVLIPQQVTPIDDVDRALNLIIEHAVAAKAALSDEHEGHLRDAVQNMHAIALGLKGLVESW